MCTLDTNVRKLYEEVSRIVNSLPNIEHTREILTLLKENPNQLYSLEGYYSTYWYFSQDGFIEFMPDKSCLFAISLRDFSFQEGEDDIVLIGDSDQYLRSYEFQTNCPFFFNRIAIGTQEVIIA